MRIMYILRSFAVKAGTERVISDKMNYLSGKGHKVSMVTYEQGKHPHAFPLIPDIQHYNIDAPFFTLGKYPLWKRYIKTLQMRHHFAKSLQQTIDKEQPDILIATTYSMKLLDIVLKVKTSAHRLLESHVASYTVRKTFDFRNRPFLRRIAALYDEMVFSRLKRFEKVIALTQGDAKDWSKYTKNVMVIPNPVTFYPETVKQHDGSGHRIICVGRIHEQKGFDMLIQAFAMIADKCPEWHIDIFGNGEDEQMLLEEIHKHQLDGRIVINKPTNHIYEEYQDSDFFVLSSRYEGYPLVLNEAMSCGIPCVAFRCKYGPEDAITHGVNGLLAEDGNVEDLAQQILWMIEHPTERLAMGEKARTDTYRYLLETIMFQWEKLFNSL